MDFCTLYFPHTFTLPFCDDHRRVIDLISTAVRRGGQFALAMPRGSGKTTLCETACMWAILNGHRDFVALIGASRSKAVEMLDSIKSELEKNDRLAADYPEVCVAVAAIEGIAQRAGGQLFDDERTHVVWSADRIVMPTIRPAWGRGDTYSPYLRGDGSTMASGAIIKVSGLTGSSIRGMKFKRPDGRSVRPSLVVIDDPQTDTSAKSLGQCDSRERLLAGAVLGMADPGKTIASLMPCTVIQPGDLADRILDRGKHPEWNGERTKLVYTFPADMAIWDRYHEIRNDSLRAGRRGVEANEFYRANRAAMDAGSVVAWPERHKPDELSAIQHAMNLRFANEATFFAEYQNEPLVATLGIDEITCDQVAEKINRIERGRVPIGSSRLTAFIDVQATLLYWVVCGWADDFTGAVVDYGTFPDQQRPYFTLRDAKHVLADAVRDAGLEGQIYAGLGRTTDAILGREWRRDDGASMRIERCLIDANWGQSSDVVYQFCRQSAHAAIVIPSHGRFVGASSSPFADYKPKPGDRIGRHWRIPKASKREVRYVLFDSNYWKSFIHERIGVAMGDRSCLALFGDRPETHRMFADHVTAEFSVATTARDRTVDEWKVKPNVSDNHWFDCLVGCAVAAAIQGSTLADLAEPAPKKKPKRNFAADRAAARAAGLCR